MKKYFNSAYFVVSILLFIYGLRLISNKDGPMHYYFENPEKVGWGLIICSIFLSVVFFIKLNQKSG